MRWVILSGLLVLASCVAAEPPHVIAQNSRSVIVQSNQMGVDQQALDLAEASCQKHGLHARKGTSSIQVQPAWVNGNFSRWNFDCVP
jgi:hypothetical protein